MESSAVDHKRQGGWCFTGWGTRYVFIYQDCVFHVSLPTRKPWAIMGYARVCIQWSEKQWLHSAYKRTKQNDKSALACFLNIAWTRRVWRKTKWNKALQPATAVLGGSDGFSRLTDAQTKISVRNDWTSELWSVWLDEKQTACLLITWQVLSEFKLRFLWQRWDVKKEFRSPILHKKNNNKSRRTQQQNKIKHKRLLSAQV